MLNPFVSGTFTIPWAENVSHYIFSCSSSVRLFVCEKKKVFTCCGCAYEWSLRQFLACFVDFLKPESLDAFQTSTTHSAFCISYRRCRFKIAENHLQEFGVNSLNIMETVEVEPHLVAKKCSRSFITFILCRRLWVTRSVGFHMWTLMGKYLQDVLL